VSLDLPPTQKLLMQQQEASLMLMGQCAVQLFTRLSEKRIAVEKEFSKIPAPPKASKDVFQLCRGFERAFAQTLEVSVYQSISTAHASVFNMFLVSLVYATVSTQSTYLFLSVAVGGYNKYGHTCRLLATQP